MSQIVRNTYWHLKIRIFIEIIKIIKEKKKNLFYIVFFNNFTFVFFRKYNY